MRKIFVLKFNLPKTKLKYTKNCNWKDTVRWISWLIWPQNQFSWWQTLSLGFKKKIFVLPKNFSDISNTCTITSDLVRQDSSLTVRRIYTTHILWMWTGNSCETKYLQNRKKHRIIKTFSQGINLSHHALQVVDSYKHISYFISGLSIAIDQIMAGILSTVA